MPARWLRSAVLVLASMTLFACSPQADVPAPTATSETTATTAPPPTPEELAADAAMTAFTELLRVTDAASQDPGAKDWEPEIRQYAGDPYAFGWTVSDSVRQRVPPLVFQRDAGSSVVSGR